MNTITIKNKTEKQLEVNVPFAIKDIFKKAIKAKWNAEMKTWIIANTEENIKAINEINNELKEFDNDIEEVVSIKAELEAMKAQLAELKAIKKELEAVKVESQEVVKEIEVSFETMTAEFTYEDLNVAQVVARAKNIAEKYKKAPKSNLKSEFYALQSFLRDVYDKVIDKYGLELKTIYRVSAINLNRLDRDLDVFNENIFIVKKSD